MINKENFIDYRQFSMKFSNGQLPKKLGIYHPMVHKKGFFFSFLMLALVSLIVLSSLFYADIYERKAIQQRVQTMNAFLFSLEEDLERNVYIAGYRTIFLLEKDIAEKGNFINNLNNSVEELFFNGSLGGVQQQLMFGAKFGDIEQALRDKAKVINVNVSLLSPTFEILQNDPWNVRAVLRAQLFFVDAAGLASWNTSIESSAFIPLKAFDDPLYIIGTSGQAIRKIVQTPYSVFVQGTDISNLSAHVMGHYYIASNRAPSFLERLEGRADAHPQGIESFVELPELSAQGISTEAKSAVDFIYFSFSNPNSHQIIGMPSWFRLDDASLAVYNATGLAF